MSGPEPEPQAQPQPQPEPQAQVQPQPQRPRPNGSDSQLGWAATTGLGLYFVGVAVLLGYVLYIVWQSGVVDASGKVDEVKLILIVMVSGALGSYVHTATSFADFVGNRRLGSSWVWWYFLRPFIGVALALVFYFAVRAGLLPLGSDVRAVSLFGIAAISALAGMFSKQATDKLREVFDTLFKTTAGDQRADKLHNPLPSITAIDPASLPAGGGEVKITIKGSNFIEESVVRVNDSERPTDFTSTTQLVAHLTPADTQTPGAYLLTVFNPPPGGGASSPMQLLVQTGA